MNMMRMPGWRLATLASELNPVESRHHHVGDQQIEIMFARERKRGGAVADRIDRMSGALQPPRQENAELFVVFGEKDARHRGGARQVKTRRASI